MMAQNRRCRIEKQPIRDDNLNRITIAIRIQWIQTVNGTAEE